MGVAERLPRGCTDRAGNSSPKFRRRDLPRGECSSNPPSRGRSPDRDFGRYLATQQAACGIADPSDSGLSPRSLRRYAKERSPIDNGCGMENQGIIRQQGFWPLALLWLPAGVIATALVRFGLVNRPWSEPGVMLMAAQSLIVVAPCGLPLALGCRQLWRLGYRCCGTWTAGIGLATITHLSWQDCLVRSPLPCTRLS